MNGGAVDGARLDGAVVQADNVALLVGELAQLPARLRALARRAAHRTHRGVPDADADADARERLPRPAPLRLPRVGAPEAQLRDARAPCERINRRAASHRVLARDQRLRYRRIKQTFRYRYRSMFRLFCTMTVQERICIRIRELLPSILSLQNLYE